MAWVTAEAKSWPERSEGRDVAERGPKPFSRATQHELRPTPPRRLLVIFAVCLASFAGTETNQSRSR
jgi:hypothetical protein